MKAVAIFSRHKQWLVAAKSALMTGFLVSILSCTDYSSKYELNKGQDLTPPANITMSDTCEYPYPESPQKGVLTLGVMKTLADIVELSNVEGLNLADFFEKYRSSYSVIGKPTSVRLLYDGNTLLDFEAGTVEFSHTPKLDLQTVSDLRLDERVLNSITFRILPFYVSFECLMASFGEYKEDVLLNGFEPVKLKVDVPIGELVDELALDSEKIVARRFSAWRKGDVGISFTAVKLNPSDVDQPYKKEPELYHLILRIVDVTNDLFWGDIQVVD